MIKLDNKFGADSLISLPNRVSFYIYKIECLFIFPMSENLINLLSLCRLVAY